MKNFKKKDGITLIALVVTIVVLLILAGVTINLVIGDNGLITKAQEARATYEQDAVNTQIAIESLENELATATENTTTGNETGGEDSGEGEETETPIDMSTFYLQQTNECDGDGQYTYFKIIGNYNNCDLYYWYDIYESNDITSEEELINNSMKYDVGDILSNVGRLYDTHVFIYLSKNNGQTIDSPIIRFEPSNICFKEDTLVSTEEGLKEIKDIKVGDYVYSYNEQSNIVEKKEVLKVFKNRIQAKLCEVSVDNEKIISTTNHPFYSNGRWVKAYELRKNDTLKSQFGANLIVDKNPILIEEQENIVYNLEVKDNHNYFVGTSCILVHNRPGYGCSYEGTIVYGEVFEF